MAGAFGYEKAHYDVSVAVAELQLIPALKANPDATIVATGTSCRHQIRDLTGRQALHPVEVLNQAGSGCPRTGEPAGV
jgi:Fe-S oxidoreductase